MKKLMIATLGVFLLMTTSCTKDYSGFYTGKAIANGGAYSIDEESRVIKISGTKYQISFSNAVWESNVTLGQFNILAFADGHTVTGVGRFTKDKVVMDLDIDGRGIVFTGYR